MTQNDLIALVLKWQRRLRLQDWHIACKFAPWHEIDGKEAQAEIFANAKRAVIKVCQEGQGKPWEGFEGTSVESCVVHELLHIHFEMAKENDTMLEQSVWSLEWAFMSLNPRS